MQGIWKDRTLVGAYFYTLVFEIKKCVDITCPLDAEFKPDILSPVAAR